MYTGGHKNVLNLVVIRLTWVLTKVTKLTGVVVPLLTLLPSMQTSNRVWSDYCAISEMMVLSLLIVHIYCKFV